MKLFYDSAMIGEIHQAMRYSQEPERIRRNGYGLVFVGDNHEHHIKGVPGKWMCECNFYRGRQICSHTMTLERLENERGQAFVETLLTM